jgi:hypothetical protein
MKNPIVTLPLNICLLVFCTLTASCDKQGPNNHKQAPQDRSGSLSDSGPNDFLQPSPSCPPVTDVRFYGETFKDGYSNWQVGWSDVDAPGHTYIVALYDSRVSATQPIWQWQLTEKNLNVGVLEGRPDSVQTPYSIKIQVKCSPNTASIIVTEDVAMK